MKIHKNCKVELAASQDASRTAIAEPYLDIKDGKGQLIATDGKIMAIIPVPVNETDVAGYLSGDVLKMARKLTKRDNETEISANGSAVMTGATMPREGVAKDRNYPNWRQVIPASDKEHTYRIGIDAKRLWLLAQAMGTQQVILKIKAPDAVFMVEPFGTKFCDVRPVNMDARGIIMPVKLE